MDAIRRRLSGQSRVPLGVHLRIRRRRRLLLRLDRTARNARGRLGGEAELLRQPKPGSRRVLYALQAHFRCGSIRPDRSDKTLKWETRKLDELVEQVVPHFIRYPLLSAKQLDFERLAYVCRLMADGEHRSRQGLIKIVAIVRDMNPDGRRRYDADELLGTLFRAEMKG